MNVEDAVSLAVSAAEAGGEVAHRSFRDDVPVETKSEQIDVVTQIDRDAQRRVVDVIRTERPEDSIVGEEEDGLKEVPETGTVWIVDPIDGTNNFVHDNPLWATSVAVVEDGEAVAAANVLPAFDDTYIAGDAVTLNGERVSVNDRADPESFVVAPLLWWPAAERTAFAAICETLGERFGDIRRFGSAQYTLSMIAAGQLEGAVSNVVGRPWDTVAGVYMIRLAGGTVTDVHGDRWEPGAQGIVASNGQNHDELLAAAQAGFNAGE